MSDLITSIVLNLQNSQFTRGLRQSDRAVQGFTNHSRKELRGLKHEFRQLTGGTLQRFRNELVAIGAGFTFVKVAKDTAYLNKNLTRMSQTAGVARSETQGLRKDLFDLQKQYGVMVDSSRKANDSLLQAGLDWRQAAQATKAIAPASSVTGADSTVLASGLAVGAEIFDYDLAQVGVATKLLDKMTVAGRLGNAELENLSSIFSRVGPNAKQANLSFDQTLGFIEQLSLIERTPERLATLADSTLRIFTNQKYAKNVTDKLGVKFYDDNGARRDTFNVIDDIATLYKKQDTDQQRDAFVALGFGETDLDTQKGIKQLLSGNSVAGMQDITEQVSQANGVIERDLTDAIDNSIDQVSRLSGALQGAANDFVEPLNKGVNTVIKTLLDNKDQGGMGLDGKDILLGGAGIVAGGVALYKGAGFIKGLLGKGGSLAGGVAAGKALEETVGVTPVYVVNMPNGFGGMPAVPGVADLPRKIFSKSKTAMALLAGTSLSKLPMYGASALGWAGAGVAAAGATGWGIGSLINEGIEFSDNNWGTDIGDAIGEGIAHVMMALGSDDARRALIANGDLEERVTPIVYSRSNPVPTDVNASLKIEVDDKRVKVKRVSSQNMDTDVYSGSTMGVMP